MALYGFDVKPISRAHGGSVAKTASYILRQNIRDSYSGETHYYAHVKDCVHWEILLPENAPREFLNLDRLLTAIDGAEKRYDARTGRVVRLTLPNDINFSDRERITLARTYIREAFISQGMCAVMAIHAGLNDDPSKNNPHAHVILTDRPIDAEGFCSKKNREWNKTEQLRRWRQLWADVQNRAFKEKGLEIEISHESLEVQGIDREPTRPLGREATALERKGIQTERGNWNRRIEARQREQQEQDRLPSLERHLYRGRSR